MPKCPLGPEKHGTERPLRHRLTIVGFALVAAARFLGGQLFVPLTDEIGPPGYSVNHEATRTVTMSIYTNGCT